MQTIVVILVAFVREIVLSRATLRLENIALRQQVAVLKRARPRPWFRPVDRVFWVFLSRLWPRWKDPLVIVKPETVIGWHRQGFRLFQQGGIGEIVAFPQVGGLHHRYERLAA